MILFDLPTQIGFVITATTQHRCPPISIWMVHHAEHTGWWAESGAAAWRANNYQNRLITHSHNNRISLSVHSAGPKHYYHLSIFWFSPSQSTTRINQLNNKWITPPLSIHHTFLHSTRCCTECGAHLLPRRMVSLSLFWHCWAANQTIQWMNSIPPLRLITLFV